MANSNSKILEVCINADNVENLAHNLRMVSQSGAKRIELCANMEFGGTTPSAEAIQKARTLIAAQTELLVMIRPQPQTFVMTTADITKMQAQIELAATNGATGVVFGAITAKHNLARTFLAELMNTAQQQHLKVTFHRAFDDIDGQFKALDTLVELGVSRVLTSGVPWHSALGASEGYEHIQTLMNHAQGQIEFVIGGRVSQANATRLWQLAPQPHYPMSLHAYSGVLTKQHRVCPHAIEAILNA